MRELHYALTLAVARLVIPFKSTIASGSVSFLNTPVKRKTSISYYTTTQ